MNDPRLLILFIVVAFFLIIRLRSARKKRTQQEKLAQIFPPAWRSILEGKVLFYSQLNEVDKRLFERRIQRFVATKSIEGIDTDIDDTVRLFVAAGAVIPTFAFPDYNYPNVQTVLVYPNSFDEQFQTKRFDGHREFITGMVGNRSLNGTVILSKPDLLESFTGKPNRSNVSIHEFVHLLDKEDGEIDGIPEVLIQRPFVGPWLFEIKKEMQLIESGKSDINPYALTNNAEFLAVVSEYFFDNPDKFKERYPDLYNYLSKIFNSNKAVQTG